MCCAPMDMTIYERGKHKGKIPRDGDQRIDSSTCYAILKLPSPASVLRHERLTYLSQTMGHVES